MAKQKEYICPYCKNKVLESESIKVKSGKSNRYFHPECKERKEQEDEEKKQYANDYKSLIEYICQLHNIDAPTGMILKQIKDFQNDYGYKLKGIELALRYFHETLGNPVREGDGIGIVVYMYEEAKRQYLKKMKIKESVEKIDSHKQKETIVYIKPQHRKNKKIIDISSIE